MALSPLLSSSPVEAFTAVQDAVRKDEEKQFLLFIMQNGLGPFWHDLIRKTGTQSLFSPEFTRELRNITSFSASLYLFQKIALDKIDNIFARRSVPYAVFKGAHTRELIYTNPELRYACDLDILVSKSDKVQAIRSLIEAGFAFQPEADNISHEATLTDSRVAIDLHWDILRPGRTRIDLTDDFLAAGKEYSGYRVLDNETTLFVLLVHPVFTKYATAPQSSLLHLLDLYYWIGKQEIDWNRLQTFLEQGGVKTAAWITATWLEMLTGKSLPEPFMHQIRPSWLKSRYLQTWLEKNLSTCLLKHPFLIQAGFTLPAHDTLADALRFLQQLRQEKKEAPRKTEELLNALK